MVISFQDVTPAPLADSPNVRSDIWKTKCIFKPGLVYNVVAPSGKGKTTFVHLMYGLRNDYSGDVSLGEDEARSIGPSKWSAIRKDEISIVFQDLRLFLRLTATENINVKSALYKNADQEKIAGMANLLGVGHVMNRPCETLSYGERQRIAIIRALIQPFRWLFLDEPFSHLDVATAHKAAELIASEVAARKAGLIMTSLGPNDIFKEDIKIQL